MEEIKSPCNEICIMDEESGFCIGCLRTGEEISSWSSYSDEEKLRVLKEIKQRSV